MSIVEKFWKWWNANWQTIKNPIPLAAYRAGYEQGYIDGKGEIK